MPWRVYRGNPHWVPPLLSEMRDILDERKNPFWRHARRWLYIVWRRDISGGPSQSHGSCARVGPEGRWEWPVGRIAAITDENFNAHQGVSAGFFGFFECEHNPEAAAALVDAAKEKLRALGCTKLIGPVSPSTNDECGLLVNGFSLPPVMMMPYNPDYYPALLEQQGLRKGWDLLAWRYDALLPLSERIGKIVGRILKSGKIRVRRLDMPDFDNEVQRVREIYNAAWDKNRGFAPMTETEMEYAASKFKPLVRPDDLQFAYIDGVLAGMVLMLPDINPLLREFNGRMGPLDVLRFFTARRRINFTRVIALGVKPEFRRTGLESVLYAKILEAGGRLGVRGGELSWTLDENKDISSGIQAMGGEIYKTYRIYEMPL